MDLQQFILHNRTDWYPCSVTNLVLINLFNKLWNLLSKMSKTNFIVTLFNITRQVLQKELISIFYIWLIIELGTNLECPPWSFGDCLDLLCLRSVRIISVRIIWISWFVAYLQQVAASIFQVVPTGCCSIRDDFMIRKSHHCFSYFR